MYKKLKDIIHPVAFEAIKQETGRKVKQWWNKDIDILVKEKQKGYEKWLATHNPDDRKEYARINRYVEMKVKKSKSKFFDEKSAEVGKYVNRTNIEIYKNDQTRK